VTMPESGATERFVKAGAAPATVSGELSSFRPVCTENSILPEIGRIRAEGVASKNLICLIQDRPAARAESGTPHESGPFSAESSFRYTHE